MLSLLVSFLIFIIPVVWSFLDNLRIETSLYLVDIGSNLIISLFVPLWAHLEREITASARFFLFIRSVGG